MKVVVSQQLAVGSQHQLPALKSSVNIAGIFTGKMHRLVTKISMVFLLCFLHATTIAQGDTLNTPTMRPVDMATGLRSNGKIYVVVVVLVIILLGLFLYLTRLDRKMTRLEKGTWKD